MNFSGFSSTGGYASRQLAVNFAPPAQLGPGVYDDTIMLSVCNLPVFPNVAPQYAYSQCQSIGPSRPPRALLSRGWTSPASVAVTARAQ
jgi:hypothetical protein